MTIPITYTFDHPSTDKPFPTPLGSRPKYYNRLFGESFTGVSEKG